MSTLGVVLAKNGKLIRGEIVKPGTKEYDCMKGAALFNAGSCLNDCYGRCSAAKHNAENNIIQNMKDCNGSDYHICSYCVNTFTCAYKVEGMENDYFIYETPMYRYIIPCGTNCEIYEVRDLEKLMGMKFHIQEKRTDSLKTIEAHIQRLIDFAPQHCVPDTRVEYWNKVLEVIDFYRKEMDPWLDAADALITEQWPL